MSKKKHRLRRISGVTEARIILAVLFAVGIFLLCIGQYVAGAILMAGPAGVYISERIKAGRENQSRNPSPPNRELLVVITQLVISLVLMAAGIYLIVQHYTVIGAAILAFLVGFWLR